MLYNKYEIQHNIVKSANKHIDSSFNYNGTHTMAGWY